MEYMWDMRERKAFMITSRLYVTLCPHQEVYLMNEMKTLHKIGMRVFQTKGHYQIVD